MTYPEYEVFCEQSTDYLIRANESAHRHFGIGNYARYEYDLNRAEIWWSDLDSPKVRAKSIVVGTISKTSETWLWGWANPHFEPIDRKLIKEVRAFGEREEIQRLVEESWVADEVDGWEMTAISARLLEAQGAYRSPGESVSLFLVYYDLEFIPDEEMVAYRPLKRPEPSSDTL